MLVAKREPTPGYYDAYSVGTPKWAFWEKHGQREKQDHTFTLVGRVLLVKQEDYFLFLGSGGMDAPQAESMPWCKLA